MCSADLVGIGLSLLRAMKLGRPICVIQVGAFDGTTSDPLRSFLDAEDIHACLLEPQEGPFEKLASLYRNSKRITPLRMALADHNGSLKMSTSALEGSAMASAIQGHNKRFGIDGGTLREIQVPCITAASLLQKCGWPQIDFLQVDVEGYDWDVVNHFLQISVEPLVINFELLHLDRKTRLESAAALKKRGYHFIDNHLDRIAFHSALLK